MTVVVGMMCGKDVVIASDSREEFHRGINVKRLSASKILLPSREFILAGAGAAAVMTPGTELCRRKDGERLYKRMTSEAIP
jgi:20S proteasome alpha/beta subunit